MSWNDQLYHQDDSAAIINNNNAAAIPRRRRSRRVRQVSARYPVGHRNSGRSSCEIENFFNMEEGQVEAEGLFEMQGRSSSIRSIATNNSNVAEAVSEENRCIGNAGSFSSSSNEQYIVENSTTTTTNTAAKLQPIDVKGIFRFPSTFTQKPQVNPAA